MLEKALGGLSFISNSRSIRAFPHRLNDTEVNLIGVHDKDFDLDVVNAGFIQAEYFLSNTTESYDGDHETVWHLYEKELEKEEQAPAETVWPPMYPFSGCT